MWRCSACSRQVCPECKESQPLFSESPAVAGLVPADLVPCIAASNSPRQSVALVVLLRKLPPVVTLLTPEFIPKRARRRFGRLCVVLVSKLVGGIHAGAADQELEVLCRLVLAMPLLLLRRPASAAGAKPSQEDPACTDPMIEPNQWKTLRSRLQLAEAGLWHQLVEEALKDVQAVAVQTSAKSEWVLAPSETEPAAARLHRRGIAAGKVRSECIRSASQLLKGESMLPPCAATCTQVMDLLVTSLPPEEQSELGAALEKAWQAGEGHGVLIHADRVRARVAGLRSGAQPGPSKTRNSYMDAILEAPGGEYALTGWCQLWADGNIPAVVARLFTAQVLRPLRKPSGGPRNISLLECLFKLASGVVQDTLRLDCGGEGLDWDQYGGHKGGPELMLMVGQGMMTVRPELAFVSLDVANAYGTMHRATMLDGTARWCPAHARFLCALWQVPNVAWLETRPGIWEPVEVADGTAQGDTSSTPSYSRGLRLVLSRVTDKLTRAGIWAHIPSLVDDMLLVTAPEHVDQVVDIVQTELNAVGAELKLEKCAALVPAWDREGKGSHPSILSVPQVSGGLPALGAAYGGDFEALLGPVGVAAAPARKRLEAAIALADACAEFAVEHHAQPTRQAAWCVLQRVAAKALVYDTRVLEPSASLPLAEALDAAVAKAARRLLGPMEGGWRPDTYAQLQWPSSAGGCGLGSAALAAMCGRVACLAQLLPTARSHLKRIFPDLSEAELLAAVPLDGAVFAMDTLKARGIELTVTGGLARGAEPRLDLREHFAPVAGIMGTVVNELTRMQHETTLADLAGKDRRRCIARIRSAAGGAGRWIETIPSRPGLRLRDAEFVTGLRWRLGLPLVPGGMRCQLKAKDAEKRCGCCLDVYGDHVAICSRGGGPYRVHNSIARLLASFARECGARAELEITVPELLSGTPGSEDAVEARLDLHVWAAAPWPMELWVDVTHRHAWASRYQAAAVRADGAAAQSADSDKRERYGEGRDGVAVTSASIESWGRFGHGFDWLLACLEARKAAMDHLPAHAAACVGRRWREEIGIAQVRSFHLAVSGACQQLPAAAAAVADTEGK